MRCSDCLKEFNEIKTRKKVEVCGKLIEGTFVICPHCGQEFTMEEDIEEFVKNVDNERLMED
jgi:DNA-directed RNA polymerase subunit RPC12/RpoP